MKINENKIQNNRNRIYSVINVRAIALLFVLKPTRNKNHFEKQIGNSFLLSALFSRPDPWFRLGRHRRRIRPPPESQPQQQQ